MSNVLQFHILCQVPNLALLIAENASLNAANVNALDEQNIGKYSSGPCEWMHSCI